MWCLTLAIVLTLGGKNAINLTKPVLTHQNATCTSGTCGRNHQCSNDQATGPEKTERAAPDVAPRRSGRRARGGLVARLRLRNESRQRRCASRGKEQRACGLGAGREEQPSRSNEALPDLGATRRPRHRERSSARGRYSEKSTHTTLLFNRSLGGRRSTRQPVLVRNRIYPQKLAMG